MVERPAVNASPLIHLSRGGRIDLLQLAAERLVVPRAVAEEIGCRGADDVTARTIRETEWLEVVETPSVPERILAWGLGPGESSVLAWCLAQEGTEAVLDDLAGRRCAASLGIAVRGTLGLVLVARKRERIPAARPVLEELRRAGMYLSNRVLERALASVGE